MNAPYFESFSLPVYLSVSVIIGFFFGFFLERAGFSSPKILTGQFFFKNWAVLKVMFTAVLVAVLGLGYLAAIGWIDMSQVFIPPTYLWPQIVGGFLLGVGFILGGYCPGTSVAAAAIGKLDALFFMAGITLGSFLFGQTYPAVKGFANSGNMGTFTIPMWLNVNTGIIVLAVVLMAIGAFWAAENSEGKWNLFAKTYGRSAGGDEE